MAEIAEIGTLIELSEKLTEAETVQLQTVIQMPEGLCKEVSKGKNFLTAIKQWNEHNPYQFYLALESLRPDLTTIACKVSWLCVSTPNESDYEDEALSIKTLIDLLKSEIPKDRWAIIYMVIANEAKENVDFESTLTKMIEKGFIQKDLNQLSQIMKVINREDIVLKMKAYQKVFSGMEEGEFEWKFKKEVGHQAKELKEWENKLKDFSKSQFKKVKQMLGDNVSVSLEQVYVELTILKEEPKEIDLEDETTYNEIAYLRMIANKEVKITPIDFTQELYTYKQEEPEIWCIIGNPGCGKTFLAKRTALRFSSSELIGIKYSISIPCRNTDWHVMESTRYENEIEIEKEYISKWLCLGLPKGANWSNDLAKHLAGSDGEGLLMIIDGLDEFTRKVPFGKTFLCSLLARQTLTKSTIIFTSRPGAWTAISTQNELNIDRYYQVLGFSPQNRDIYFKKQITNELKLEECMALMERHDEIKQLALIPVNASLFAALMKGEASASFNSITKLYYELTLYMVRRELARIGLQQFSRVSQISILHLDILDCLYRIGFIALVGVANRDLASEEKVTLVLEQEEYTCQCLGLAHEHYRKESIGLLKTVWTFAHLTMQEFVSALYLEHTTWTEQCYSVRYISHSKANLSLFRMVLRFLCGLLSDEAAALLSISYRYLTPQPIQLIDLPICYQLNYEWFYHHEAWNELTDVYIQLSTIIYETNSVSVPNWFAYFKRFFPSPIYLYVQQIVSPNEWICFVQSLKHAAQIQLIYIDTNCSINPTQLNSLIQEMRICSVSLLALNFLSKDSATVISYTDILREKGMMFDTKISIELYFCNFTVETDVSLFPTSANQILFCISLIDNVYSYKALQEVTNQLSTIQCVYVCQEHKTSYEALIPALCQATQLRLLHIHGIPSKHIPALIAVLPQFSKLQEIAFSNFSLLPAISNLSNLTYLKIGDNTIEDTTLCPYLLQTIIQNRHSLRGMELWYLHILGLTKWSSLLNCLELCTNLVRLKLWRTTLPTNDVTHWSRAVRKMNSLVELIFNDVSLFDTGLLSLCEGLIYHPAIRSLQLEDCGLTSLSCEPLIHLIPTISQLEILTVTGLSKPDGDPLLLLQETVDEFSIELKLV